MNAEGFPQCKLPGWRRAGKQRDEQTAFITDFSIDRTGPRDPNCGMIVINTVICCEILYNYIAVQYLLF
jgi:hypothetical protein